MTFQGGNDGRAELEFPTRWAGETGLEGQIKNLKALSPNTVISDGPSAQDHKMLMFPAHSTVTISYDLVKDWSGLFRHPLQFRAILEPSYFEFNTQNALAHPKLDSTETVNVRFDWQKLPSDWSLATSFGASERCQSFTGFWHKVNDALFAGGDFRVHQVSSDGQNLVIAIRGKWSFTDTEAIQRIEKILSAEKFFWHDNDFSYYLVTMAPYDTTGGSTDGSAFTNAFWIFLSRGQDFSYDIQNTLAHETFHSWNPHKMGPTLPPEGSVQWFSEGFTAYYSDLMLAHAGLLSLPEYVAILNRLIAKYEFSPVKNLSNSEVVKRYHESQAINDLSYVRGPVIALWLDGKIREQSKGSFSLDNVMYDMVQDTSRDPRRPLTTQRVLQTAGKYLSQDDRRRLTKYADLGITIPIPEFPFGRCVRKSVDQVGPFELGFDRDVLRTKSQIANVNPHSEAYKAGVRDGQQVLGVSIYYDDLNKPVHLRVSTPEGIKTIEYLPQGKSVPISQYHLVNETLAATPEFSCAFAGTTSSPHKIEP
jgi:predicted metalloprotease with PDZ domain